MTNSAGLLEQARYLQAQAGLKGEILATEKLLEQLPGLASDPAAVLELAYGEYLLREEAGEVIDRTAFSARFPSIAHELERQFAFHSALDATVSTRLAPSGDGDAVPPEGQLLQIGRFELVRELGRGGFGIVYLARDPLIGREVALKAPRLDVLARADARARFLHEARAAAGLEHPGIVPVYEAGEIGPLCYVVSAYCPGRTLAAWLADRPEAVPDRLAARIVHALASAVAYSHSRGVLHRDLKPANVMLEFRHAAEHSTDELPFVPRVMDFGLAKLAAGALTETRTGEVLGTPLYMAPEQAAGRQDQIGPASDVYALGGVLYELLAGQPPFAGSTPWQIFEKVQWATPTPPRKLRREISRDLETICLKCLEKEPARRYASCDALVDDLGRWLRCEPIAARPPTPLELAWSVARKHPAWTALAGVCLVAAVLVAAAVVDALRTRHSAAIAAAQARHELEVADYLRVIENTQLPRIQRTPGWRAAAQGALSRVSAYDLDVRSPALLRKLLAACLGEVDWQEMGVVAAGRKPIRCEFLQSGDLVVVDFDVRGAPTLLAFDGITLASRQHVSLPPPSGVENPQNLVAVALSPDGCRVGAVFQSGAFVRWDVKQPDRAPIVDSYALPSTVIYIASTSEWITGNRVGLHRWSQSGPQTGSRPLSHGLGSCDVSEETGTLAAVAPLAFCDLHLANHRQFRDGTDWLGAPTFTQDGRMLAVTYPGRATHLVDMQRGRYARTVAGFEARQQKFSPDGRFLVADTGHAWTIIDLVSGRVANNAGLSDAPRVERRSPAFSTDGRRLALALPDGVHVFQTAGLEPGAVQSHLALHARPIWTFEFSPDGSRLACISADAQRVTENPSVAAYNWHEPTVTLWNANTGQREALLDSDHFAVSNRPEERPALAFHPSGDSLVVGSDCAQDHVWSRRPEGWVRSKIEEGNGPAVYSSDGEWLWGVARRHMLRRWAAPARRADGIWSGYDSNWEAVADEARSHAHRLCQIVAGQKRVYAAMIDGTLWTFDACTGEKLAAYPGDRNSLHVALNPDETLLVRGALDGRVHVTRAADGGPVAELTGHDGPLETAAFSPDGRYLATAGRNRTFLWRCRRPSPGASGVAQATFDPVLEWEHASPMACVKFHPDGQRLAMLLRDEHAVRVWRIDRLRAEFRKLNIDWAE